MPRPAGFEPYSLFWEVHWDVQNLTLQINRPRMRLVGSSIDADALKAFLESVAKRNTDGAIYPGSTYIVGPMKYFNRKSFVENFVSGLAATIFVG